MTSPAMPSMADDTTNVSPMIRQGLNLFQRFLDECSPDERERVTAAIAGGARIGVALILPLGQGVADISIDLIQPNGKMRQLASVNVERVAKH
jgi:hypothetical protein